METNSNEYKEHLEEKYLPGRNIYLKHVFYPAIFKYLNYEGVIADMGCGTGEFLNYCQYNNQEVVGIDSNRYLVDYCKSKGHEAFFDDITTTPIVKEKSIKNIVCDNVLEHLKVDQIRSFFSNLTNQMEKEGRIVIIVPCQKGYERDPTHHTYVDKQLIESICEEFDLKLTRRFFHPFDSAWVGKYLYLNMQVYVIKR